jgi:hypothetical protein
MCVMLLNNTYQLQENMMNKNGDLSPIFMHKPGIHPERTIIFMNPQSKSS